MTRKEQITDAAFFYANKNKKEPCPYLDFIEAVEWADRTMIEKACEKLESMLYMRDCGDYDCVASSYDTVEEFIDQFRKYMEE